MGGVIFRCLFAPKRGHFCMLIHNSGYVKLSESVYKEASQLVNRFTPFSTPETQATAFSKEYWLKDLYEFKMLDYLDVISNINSSDMKIKTMIDLSINGSNDGKDFEKSVKEVIDLFDDIVHTEIISGSGDTDILCVLEKESLNRIKFNIDPKKSKKGLSQINPIRITNHLNKNGSQYAMIVTSRFASGANHDIANFKIINIDAESLGRYVLKKHK